MKTLLVFGLLCFAAPGFAQSQPAVPDEPEPIVTDRPDFTEAAVVVPRRRFQIESGVTQTWGRNYRSFGFPELLFRYGTTDRLELRFGSPNYNYLRDDGVSSSGFGDTYVGAKYQVGPFKDGTDVSLIPAAFIPTGGNGFSSGTVDPEVKLCVGRALDDHYSLSGMIYFAYPTEDSRRNPTWQETISLGRSLTERLSSFVEFSNVTPQRGAPENLVHAGIAFQPTRDDQIDIHFGFGLNDAAPRSFLAGGYSVRF